MYLRDIVKRMPFLFIAVCTGIISLITTNVMWGFLAGFALQGILFMYEKMTQPRQL